MKNKSKKYAVLANGDFISNTYAVSEEKAINNVRYNMFVKAGAWYLVPKIYEFEAIEI